jgi:hypothetical protein
VDKILQIEIDPDAGMDALRHNLRRALRIEPERMEKMIALDNEAREKTRIRAGHKKRGPKPKTASSGSD